MAVALGLALGVVLACSGGSAPAQDAPGAELARSLGCFACHALHGRGGERAAALDGIGTRLTPGQLRRMIAFPRRLHPGARMPSYAYLPPEEQEALAHYLETLK
jgi:mono/diheme cytochrome c family protein